MALDVSTKWKDNIKSQFRYPGYLKVLLALVPDEIREGTAVNTFHTDEISSPVQLIDGVADVREPVATFEKNRWRGDGSQYLPSPTANRNNEMEWLSKTTNFDENNPIELFFHFSSAFSFAGLFVTWDTETNSWPTDWEVIGYRRDGSVQKSYRIKTTQSMDGFTNTPFDSVTQVRMRIYKWSRSDWRVRINEVMFGTYLSFDNDKINQANFSAAVSPIMSELPTCQFSFSFSNYDKAFDPQLQEGYAKYLTRKQLLKAQWGFETSYGNIEWMDPWPLYLSSWQIPADSQEVTLTAQSRLGFMDTEYIKGNYDGEPHNMYSLTRHILENSTVLKESNPEIPWELPESLRNFYTRAPMPIAATNVLLQLIANATGHTLDTNLRNGYIRLREPVIQTDYSVGVAQQMGDPAFDIQDRLKSIKIGLHSYGPDEKESEVFKTELTLHEAQEITCYFNSGAIVQNPQVNATNASVSIGATYARAMVINVAPIDPEQIVTITIQGTVIKESVTMLELYHDDQVARGVEVEIDNELITEVETAVSLAKYLVAYYKRRNHMNVSYLGYPELEPGDRINVPTNYGDDQGDIVSTKLTYNGGFTGTLSVVSTKEG